MRRPVLKGLLELWCIWGAILCFYRFFIIWIACKARLNYGSPTSKVLLASEYPASDGLLAYELPASGPLAPDMSSDTQISKKLN